MNMTRIRTAVAAAVAAMASCSAFTVLPATHAGASSALFDTAAAVETPVGTISTNSKTPFTDSQPSPSRQQPKQQQQQQQQKKKSGSKGSNANKRRNNNKSGSKKVNGSATTLPKRNNNRKNGSKNSSKGGNTKKRRPRPTLQPLSALKLGSKIDGVVGGISLFGAFVKTRYAIRPQDGSKSKEAGYALLHKSQISDEKIDDISKVLRVGDQIKNARVVSINYAKGEVAISLRKPRPKRRSLDEIRVGGEYDGKIANVTPYGAFVDIGAKKNALLHISRITQEKVSNIRNYVNENDWVTVHIINKDNGALACSMLDKQADEYLNKRQRQKKRKADNLKEAEDAEETLDKSELAAFEEAIRDLENAFNSKK